MGTALRGGLAARCERRREAVTRPHEVFEGLARPHQQAAAAAFARSPSSPAVFLDGAVFMHRPAAA
ncbi:hypothetical protein WG70_14115 [Burkholderia oklahomensis EO147]|nr:hypothetical protein WG70_14115 [Burkholderia oklahomensis EO147]KUY51146.1 hypothetical protein WG70_17425 [Burkholderia oklahomensis EO147]